ncbi:MAG: 16S rRNA (cytosine(1402)-N(4))-methyltransferase RsmH, partial [Firmicutes bacterium]|nr:16S rRNA (cytosine(1402)-N(4))-methyltransferase RsmH [Bacillota bacterium]
MMTNFFHKSVLFDESIELLKVREDGIYLDCTVGAGGHSQGILRLLGEEGLLLGIDQDEQALQAAEQRLSQIGSNFKLFKKNFEQLDQVISSAQVSGLDGIIFDLGVSSPQLDLDERGFSYRSDASLDMRMDLNSPSTAASLLAELN